MLKLHIISICYFITALIFGGLALDQQSEDLDLALKEVYFVLPKSFLWLVLAGVFLLFSVIALTFELFRKPMNKYLFGIHYLVTILSLIAIYFAVQQEAPPTVTTDYSTMDELREQSDDPVNWLKWLTVTSYALIGAQIVFGLNILLSIIWSRKKSA